MKLAARLAPLAIAMCACSPEPTEQAESEVIEAPIPTIKGHEIHNQLATAQLGFRHLYLSRVLRGMGEDCMVVDRSMYQGYAKKMGASLWSAHCEQTGSEWMVSVNKDGSGSILNCRDLDQLELAVQNAATVKGKIERAKCWERFKD